MAYSYNDAKKIIVGTWHINKPATAKLNPQLDDEDKTLLKKFDGHVEIKPTVINLLGGSKGDEVKYELKPFEDSDKEEDKFDINGYAGEENTQYRYGDIKVLSPTKIVFTIYRGLYPIVLDKDKD